MIELHELQEFFIILISSTCDKDRPSILMIGYVLTHTIKN